MPTTSAMANSTISGVSRISNASDVNVDAPNMSFVFPITASQPAQPIQPITPPSSESMTDSMTQPPATGEGVHLVLYDGVCGLCSRLLQFLLTHDRRGVFAFASLQSAVGRAVVEGLDGDLADLTSFYVLTNYRTRHARTLARSKAALFVASQLGWPWRAAVIAGVLPSALLDRAYNLIARNRYRVFGRFDQCLAPRPEFRRRFVE